ncbi:unnamed protein product [Calicophoron daubneyi]|uniref:Stabilizer of axonemal microtubules 2 n=1 Tax=Calicophoron daubneyi TaxID=300641 RepID=A0AAV2T5C6_CALDB
MVRPGVKCICEICCCGRHKCPHRPKAIVPWGPCVMSEYTAQYHPHCLEPNQPIVQPSNIFSSGDPISDKTTNRTDYVPHCYEQPYTHKRDPYKPPEGKMENTTLYRNEFTPKNCPPSQPIKPIERKSCAAKFDGQPTYRSDYKAWDLPPIVPRKPKEDKPPLPKFDAEPIYRREFTPKCIERLQNFKPPNLPKVYDEPFKGDTIYRTEYIPREVCPPEPAKAPTYSKSTVPFETLTTNRKDYTAKEYCPVAPIKPIQSTLASSGPMSRLTTNRMDFKDWGPQYPERASGPQYVAPQGERYMNSTYRTDFAEKPICPVTEIKPLERKMCEAKFDGTTNYRHDYQPWEVAPPAQAKRPEWVPPDTPLDTMTTNRANFVPFPCVPTVESFKPANTQIESGQFDDRTNYRTDYVPKEVCLCCPAGFLPTKDVSPDGYMFDHYDDRGHQMYRNVGTGKSILPAVQVK